MPTNPTVEQINQLLTNPTLSEDDLLAVMHQLRNVSGWDMLVATREDAQMKYRAHVEDDNATLTDEQWNAISARLDIGDDYAMEGFWDAVDFAVEQGLADLAEGR